MGDYNDLPYIVIERHSGSVPSFLWGALLGVGAALLFAPRSGRETQREIREGARRLREEAERRVEEARHAVVDSVSDTVGRARDQVYQQVTSVREEIGSRAGQARDAVETGRRAARDSRHELERRIAEAKGERRGGDAAAAPAPEAEMVVTEVVVEEDVEGEDRPL